MEKSIHTKDYETAISLLKQERLNAGISQIELAKRLNATQTFISRYERMDRRLDLMESYQFCEAIGIDFVEYAKKLHAKIEKKIAKVNREK